MANVVSSNSSNQEQQQSPKSEVICRDCKGFYGINPKEGPAGWCSPKGSSMSQPCMPWESATEKPCFY